MTNEEAVTIANEVAALAEDLAASATRLADACKDLAADRATDPESFALTAPFTAEFEGEDG